MKTTRGIDCCLVRPNNQAVVYPQVDEHKFTALEAPLWPAILAAYVRELGYSVQIVDAQGEGLTYKETADRTNTLKPILTVLSASGVNPSASSFNMMGIQELAPSIKGPVIAHGLHPSSLPEETVSLRGVTYSCRGEGLKTIPKLLQALKYNNSAEVEDIPGLYTHATKWKPYPSLFNVRTLPPPAWDLLPMDKYRSHIYMEFDGTPRSPYGILYTSLGCPYSCTFCCINSLFGERRFRTRDEDDVIQELINLVETYDIHNIKIMDEMFTANKSRVISLCNRIADLDLNLSMRAFARTDHVDDELLESMRRAGIKWLVYGFESGSNEVLENIKKDNSLENTMRAVKLTRKHGIYLDADYMMGMPGDTDESHKRTFELALDILGEWTNIYATMAYPGSPLYDQAVGGGWDPPRSYSGWSQYTPDSSPLRGEWATRWRDWAWYSYNTNPHYLSSLAQKFGPGAVRTMADITSVKLKRNFDGQD